jgi:GNAT superfamily N-acetyltransferase
MNAVIREAIANDANAIAAIHVATWQYTYRGLMPASLLESLSVAQRTEDWKRRLEPSSRNTFVVEEEGVIRGWASIGPNRDPDLTSDFGELYGIYMAPSHIGRTYGGRLFGRCEEELCKRGYGFVALWVVEGNTGARHFYEKSGFQADGHRKTIVLGGAEVPELRYVKKINLQDQPMDPAP